jgi:hypothetical protein
MLASLGGSFAEVESVVSKRSRGNESSVWRRPASDEGYRIKHGTWYRMWVKRSKKERSKARRLAKAALLLWAILAFSTSLVRAQIAKGYVTGTLVNVEESTDDTLNKGTTLRSSFENYTVRIGDMTYTAYCAEKLITSHCDSNFVIGGPVQARVEGEHLYIVRSNGKEQKAKIFRKKIQGA